ncbi:MAG: hypothetical protein ACRCY9_03025 [Phycicoccus sp.]
MARKPGSQLSLMSRGFHTDRSLPSVVPHRVVPADHRAGDAGVAALPGAG